MLGLVLCGGQSSRMGEDKGLLRWQDQYWAGMAAERLSPFADPIMLSASNEQMDSYPKLLPHYALLEDDPGLSIGGPLKGLISTHLRFPRTDLLVLACDMPLMQQAVIEQLLKAFDQGSSEAYVFNNGGELEPLCAIYTARALSKVNTRYLQGTLTRHSMHSFIHSVDTQFLELSPEWQSCFQNLNTPAELNQYLR